VKFSLHSLSSSSCHFYFFDRVFCCRVTSYLEVLRLQNPMKCLTRLQPDASASLVYVRVCVCVCVLLQTFGNISKHLLTLDQFFSTECHAIVVSFCLIATSSHTEDSNGHVYQRPISNKC